MDFRIHGGMIEAKSLILLSEGIKLNSAELIYRQMNLSRDMVHTTCRAHWLGELRNSIAASIFEFMAQLYR